MSKSCFSHFSLTPSLFFYNLQHVSSTNRLHLSSLRFPSDVVVAAVKNISIERKIGRNLGVMSPVSVDMSPASAASSKPWLEPAVTEKVRVVANIFISFIGAGVLGLPYAFKEAGLMEGKIIFLCSLKN